MKARVAVGIALVCGAVVVVSAAIAGAAQDVRKTPNVVVTQRFVGRLFRIEGSVGYVRILDRAGRRIAENAFPLDRPKLAFSLGIGRYRLVSYQRACTGNCGHLGPPVDICSKQFRVRAHRFISAKIRVVPGSGCSIRVRSG
jgi:hypothetical protein